LRPRRVDGSGRAAEKPPTGTVTAAGPAGIREFPATVRIDTPAEAAHYRHGGILPYVLRRLAAPGAALARAWERRGDRRPDLGAQRPMG
jgi:hypothetical protein